jgi:hypothetical protein
MAHVHSAGADRARKGDLEAFDALIRETVPDLERWFYAGA